MLPKYWVHSPEQMSYRSPKSVISAATSLPSRKKVSQHLLLNMPLSAAACIKSMPSFRKMPGYTSYKSNKLGSGEQLMGLISQKYIFKNQRKSLTLDLPVVPADKAQPTAAFSSRLKSNRFNAKLCILLCAQRGAPDCLLHLQFCSVKLSSSFRMGVSTTALSSISLLQWLPVFSQDKWDIVEKKQYVTDNYLI